VIASNRAEQPSLNGCDFKIQNRDTERGDTTPSLRGTQRHDEPSSTAVLEGCDNRGYHATCVPCEIAAHGNA